MSQAGGEPVTNNKVSCYPLQTLRVLTMALNQTAWKGRIQLSGLRETRLSPREMYPLFLEVHNYSTLSYLCHSFIWRKVVPRDFTFFPVLRLERM